MAKKVDTYSWPQAWANIVPPLIISASLGALGVVVALIGAAVVAGAAAAD
jgi:hypothetical protein